MSPFTSVLGIRSSVGFDSVFGSFRKHCCRAAVEKKEKMASEYSVVSWSGEGVPPLAFTRLSIERSSGSAQRGASARRLRWSAVSPARR